MSPEEQFERDYAQGRIAGMSDALDFIHAITETLPKAERDLVIDKIWNPFRAEKERARAVRDARWS